MGGCVPHQARILFPGQFSLEHLVLGLLLLNCLFQSKDLCTQLQDLVFLCLRCGRKGIWEQKGEGKGTLPGTASSLSVSLPLFK